MAARDSSTPDAPIKAGDLVMVVRSCCQPMQRNMGVPFTVLAIEQPLGGAFECPHCNTEILSLKAVRHRTSATFAHAPVAWLKRIRPLDELDKAKDQESHPIVTGDLATLREIALKYSKEVM